MLRNPRRRSRIVRAAWVSAGWAAVAFAQDSGWRSVGEKFDPAIQRTAAVAPPAVAAPVVPATAPPLQVSAPKVSAPQPAPLPPLLAVPAPKAVAAPEPPAALKPIATIPAPRPAELPMALRSLPTPPAVQTLEPAPPAKPLALPKSVTAALSAVPAPKPAALPPINPVPPPVEPKRLPPANKTIPAAGPAFDAKPPEDPAPRPAAVAAVKPAAAPMLGANALPLSAALYRPLAQLVAETEAQRWPGTPNEMLEPVSWPRRVEVPAPAMLSDGSLPQSPTLDLSDLASCTPWWAEPMAFRMLPEGSLWLAPLADQRAPRMAVRSLRMDGASAIDTAIGGQWSLNRLSPIRRPDEGIGLEVLAAAFSRFDDRRRLQAIDYRVGLPIAYAKGGVSAKFGYEHQSSHLGDEHGEALGLRQAKHVRDEIVAAAALDWNCHWRTYGLLAHAFHIDGAFTGKNRYQLGAEFQRRRETGPGGQPFGAVDCEWREDQNHVLNATLQAGWQWRLAESGRSGRIAVERHVGNSPYGQFFLVREHWWAFAASFDF